MSRRGILVQDRSVTELLNNPEPRNGIVEECSLSGFTELLNYPEVNTLFPTYEKTKRFYTGYRDFASASSVGSVVAFGRSAVRVEASDRA